MPLATPRRGVNLCEVPSLQGTLRCCVTGPAFEQMVQYGDAALVHTVMSSVAVFARMRSQQKGQVMALLGHRGIHQQPLQGQAERHILV